MKKILQSLVFAPRMGLCVFRFKPLPRIQLETYDNVYVFLNVNLIPYLPSTELSKWGRYGGPRRHKAKTDHNGNPRMCYTVVGLSTESEKAKHEQRLADLQLESCYTPKQITDKLREGEAIDMELVYIPPKEWFSDYVWY